MNKAIQSFTLKNGLQVFLLPRNDAPVFTFQTWVKVGSKTEKLDPRLNATGLAHFFEHMMFRGTSRFADGEFDRILTREGVYDSNATTWFDRTNYYESLPTSALELVFDLESDRFQNLVLSKDLFETERGAVLSEFHQCQDDPTTVAFDRLYEAAFDHHPYRYTTIGTEAEIQGFTLEQAQYFYQTYYSSNNTALFLVGDLDPALIKKYAQKYYGHLEPAQIPRPKPIREKKPAAERRYQFRHHQIEETKLFVSYPIPEVTHSDFPSLLILGALLYEGSAAVLEKAWVNSGMASSVDGNVDQFEDPGLLSIFADLVRGVDPNRAIQAFDQQMERLGRLDMVEFERAKNYLLYELYSELEEGNQIASFLGEFIVTAGDPGFGLELPKRVEKVKKESVQKALQKYLQPRCRVIGVGERSL